MTLMTPIKNEPTSELLKIDTLGRIRVPRDQREQLLDAFEACAMSAKD